MEKHINVGTVVSLVALAFAPISSLHATETSAQHSDAKDAEGDKTSSSNTQAEGAAESADATQSNDMNGYVDGFYGSIEELAIGISKNPALAKFDSTTKKNVMEQCRSIVKQLDKRCYTLLKDGDKRRKLEFATAMIMKLSKVLVGIDSNTVDDYGNNVGEGSALATAVGLGYKVWGVYSEDGDGRTPWRRFSVLIRETMPLILDDLDRNFDKIKENIAEMCALMPVAVTKEEAKTGTRLITRDGDSHLDPKPKEPKTPQSKYFGYKVGLLDAAHVDTIGKPLLLALGAIIQYKEEVEHPPEVVNLVKVGDQATGRDERALDIWRNRKTVDNPKGEDFKFYPYDKKLIVTYCGDSH
jgi:hypothetical protein